MSRASPGMLTRILAIARKELTDASRDRRTLTMTVVSAALAGPIFLVLIFNLIASQADKVRDLTLPVVAAERAPALIDYLKRQQVTISAAPADYEARIRAGDMDVALLIDENFARDVAAGRAGVVQLVFDRSRDRAQASINEAESLLRGYDRLWGAQRLLLRGMAPTVGNPLELREVNVATPRQSGALVLFLVAFYGLLAAIVGGMAFALEATAGERERASLEPLLMTPASTLEIAIGKWMSLAIFVALIVFITVGGFYLTLAFAPLPAVGVPFLFSARDVLRFFAVLLPLIALMPAVLLWLGSRGRSIREAQANTQLLLFVVSLVPAAQMFLQRKEPVWLLYVPVSAQYVLLNRVLRGDALAAADLAQAAIVPLLLTAAAIWAFARTWSREATLSGK
ncbi:MAG TPA: ABC transporter permease [Casimicrobiaceae bacterium]